MILEGDFDPNRKSKLTAEQIEDRKSGQVRFVYTVEELKQLIQFACDGHSFGSTPEHILKTWLSRAKS